MITVTQSERVPVNETEGLSFTLKGEPSILTPDGKGGVFVHMARMLSGQPYLIVVDGTPLVAMKQDGDVILYGFPK